MLCDFIYIGYVCREVQCGTVNSEMLARVIFSRNFAYAKFREKITLAKG